jgi:hypothetical protein
MPRVLIATAAVAGQDGPHLPTLRAAGFEFVTREETALSRPW